MREVLKCSRDILQCTLMGHAGVVRQVVRQRWGPIAISLALQMAPIPNCEHINVD